MPRDHWLEAWEREAILAFHAEHWRKGYRRLTCMMMDADVVPVSAAPARTAGPSRPATRFHPHAAATHAANPLSRRAARQPACDAHRKTATVTPKMDVPTPPLDTFSTSRIFINDDRYYPVAA